MVEWPQKKYNEVTKLFNKIKVFADKNDLDDDVMCEFIANKAADIFEVDIVGLVGCPSCKTQYDEGYDLGKASGKLELLEIIDELKGLADESYDRGVDECRAKAEIEAAEQKIDNYDLGFHDGYSEGYDDGEKFCEAKWLGDARTDIEVPTEIQSLAEAILEDDIENASLEVNINNGDNMSETIPTPVEECMDDRCQTPYPNLCNDLNYTFGSNKGCRGQNHPLATTGDTMIGYAVNMGKLKHIKINWDGSHEADEVLVVTKNGQDIAWVHIDGESGTKCVEVSEWFCDCDVVNVVSRAGGVRNGEEPEVGEWKPAGCITVALWFTPKCDVVLKPEGDGVIEAFDTTGTTSVVTGGTWYTRQIDTQRLNTIPTFATFVDADDSIELEYGVYKIWYESGIGFDQSVALDYEIKLQENVNGGGWSDVFQSESNDYVLAGSKGNVVASRMITMLVPHGDTVAVRIQEMISQDTSIQSAGAGGTIVIERVANGVATMASLHAGV